MPEIEIETEVSTEMLLIETVTLEPLVPPAKSVGAGDA